MNLTVLNYILPSQSDEIITQTINSYGNDFWKNVDSHIVFKKHVSDELQKTLVNHNINYSINSNSLWLPVIVDLVNDIKTDYFSIFLEDICISSVDSFVHAFKTLDLNEIDYMPTIAFSLWNNIITWLINNNIDVESNDKYSFTRWGCTYSSFCEQSNIKSFLNTSNSPFPISVAGVFKKDFFLKTAEIMFKSDYWKIASANPDFFIYDNWAKNPRLPHSYEVYFQLNTHELDVEYTILVPKESNSYSNDPKDLYRNNQY